MDAFSDPLLLWLFLGGIPIGIFAIVLGGTMFLSLPFFQILFPAMTMGSLVGNIKMGSVLRNLMAVGVLHKNLFIKNTLGLLFLFCSGAVLGALLIASVSQVFVLPALLFAVLLTELGPSLSKHIPKPLVYLIAFLIGIFGGILGAGISLLIIAVLRIEMSDDKDIHLVRALGVFMELVLTISSVIVFASKKQLILPVWVAWSAGSLIGGYFGGKILHHTGKLSPSVQRLALRIMFVFAIAVAITKVI